MGCGLVSTQVRGEDTTVSPYYSHDSVFISFVMSSGRGAGHRVFSQLLHTSVLTKKNVLVMTTYTFIFYTKSTYVVETRHFSHYNKELSSSLNDNSVYCYNKKDPVNTLRDTVV